MFPSSTRRRAAVLAALAAFACAPADPPPNYRLDAYLEVLAAEDSRHTAGDNLQVLVAATASGDAFLRTAGVRALGRLESPELLDRIVPLLDDGDPLVRAEAANAAAQAVHRQPGSAALRPLLERLPREEEPEVLGALARSVGRLSLPADERGEVARALVAVSRSPEGGDAPGPQLLGALLGMGSFVRGAGDRTVRTALIHRLRELVRYGTDQHEQTQTMARVRAAAVTALGAAGALNVDDVGIALRDPSEGTRRAAAARLSVVAPLARPEFVRRLLQDPSHQVRFEGVRALARDPRDATACARLMTVARRELTTGVRVAALDALSTPCPGTGDQIELLADVAASLEPTTGDWHPAAHALVSLAALAPARARALLPRFAEHDNAFVRGYAARAAARVNDAALLRTLAGDEAANVRAAALTGLAEIEGPRADPLLLSTLETASEPQLVLTLAGLLAETELRDEATAAALGALERLSQRREETLRDPRVALLTLVGRVGGPTVAPEIEPYIRDADRRVADLAAGILLDWTGDRYISAPRRPQRLPLPTAAELKELLGASVVLHMARGGAITIRLHADERTPHPAPTNAFRFVRMARAGVFDGLTFHRVAPNFVIQGGSPHANEYSGHGAYTRDEVGLPAQWRGTVGVSTRGRDTGDGQIYINLVDNTRLDHDYTIIGTVTEGMDVVDAVMEGDVIERAEVRTGG